MKVTGQQRGDLRDYRIEHDGQQFVAISQGNGRFSCEELGMSNRTLSDIKHAATVPPETPEAIPSTWDCIDPCALLIVLGESSEEVRQTLDCHGWLDSLGNPDAARAEREIDRFSKITV